MGLIGHVLFLTYHGMMTQRASKRLALGYNIRHGLSVDIGGPMRGVMVAPNSLSRT
jgi:hypothetical protein